MSEVQGKPLDKKNIRHIAIAVKNLERSKEMFALIGTADVSETVEVPDQKVICCFIETQGSRIELIQPTEGNVGVANFLEKRGEGVHHICLGVNDIEATLDDLRDRGFRLIDEKPRIGAEGHRIAFIHPHSTGGVLIELEEQ